MPRAVIVSLLLAMISAAPSCAIRGRGKHFAYVVDGALATGGATLIVASAAADCEPNGIDGLLCEGGQFVGVSLGALVVAAAVAASLVNLAVNANEMPAPGPGPSPLDLELAAEEERAICQDQIAAHSAETAPVGKSLIYRDMTPLCRERLHATWSNRTGAPGSADF